MKGGNKYSNVLLNFNVILIGTSLMKNGGLLKNLTHKSYVVESCESESCSYNLWTPMSAKEFV